MKICCTLRWCFLTLDLEHEDKSHKSCIHVDDVQDCARIPVIPWFVRLKACLACCDQRRFSSTVSSVDFFSRSWSVLIFKHGVQCQFFSITWPVPIFQHGVQCQFFSIKWSVLIFQHGVQHDHCTLLFNQARPYWRLSALFDGSISVIDEGYEKCVMGDGLCKVFMEDKGDCPAFWLLSFKKTRPMWIVLHINFWGYYKQCTLCSVGISVHCPVSLVQWVMYNSACNV